MKSLDNLILVCNSFKQKKFGIEEFQSRIITSAIPDNLSRKFLESLVDFDNRIEEIMFCEAPSLREGYADKVADDLIKAVLMEQDRYKE